MENENLNEQPAPVVEKVSLKEIKQDQNSIDLEEDTPMNNLIKSMMALKGEDLDKAIAFVNKKLEILKKLRGDK